MSAKVAFQGHLGAYSHLACRAIYGVNVEVLPCPDFEDALNAVSLGEAATAVIPIENSSAGRVADMHHLLPRTNLHMVQEYFMPIHHCLLGTPNTSLEELKGVYSHPQALGQCRENIKKMHLTPHSFPDTAGAAAFIAEKQDKHQAALASTLAAETYDLKILMRNFEDEAGNTTRFVVFAPEQTLPDEKTPSQTSLLFEVKNVPSALYKAMGALASNGLNMVKLESYMLHHSFKATQFYVEVDTHLHHPAMQQGLEELGFYCENLRVLGCYAQNRPKF